MNQPLVYIVILNWNGFKDTSELLESLSEVTYRNYKVVIIDNNSLKYEVEQLDKNYGDKTHIIYCEENLGFSGGNNVGIKYSLESNADYILLLNNDVIVEPNFLEILLNKFNTDSKSGVVAPRINYFNEPNKIWTEGGKISRIRGSGFAVSDKLETEIPQTDRNVNFVSGCCMLIKREVFRNVGLFDERYFLYVEDTDFCYRLNKAGYKIYVTPRSKIYHKVNRSAIKNFSELPLYYTTRNRLYFAKKNFPAFFPLTSLYIYTVMVIKSCIWIFTDKFKKISTVRKAFKDFRLEKMGKTDFNIK